MGATNTVNNAVANRVRNDNPVETKQPTFRKPPIETQVEPRNAATAESEVKGISGDLQRSLLLRSFNLNNPATANGSGQLSPPTFPNAPLFADTPRTGADGKPVLDSNGNPVMTDGNEISMNDVQQRGLGDCYFVSSVASLARTDPQAIRDMITENRDADDNVTSYTVRFNQRDGGLLGTGLFSGNEQVSYNVLPSELIANGSAPADNGEVWVNVLEAAYAKHVGSVEELGNGGNAQDALYALTGREADSFSPGGDYSFEDLQSDFNNNRNVVLDTKSDGQDPKKKVQGSPYNLVTSHSYTLENVYTDSNGRQMVQLRNPWGYDHPQPIPFEELGRYFSDFNVN